MQRLAIYDMDKTITRQATFGPFLFYATWRYKPWRIVLAPALVVTILAYGLKLLNRAQLKEINLSLMLGGRIDAAALARISAGFAGRTLTRNVFRAALDRIDADRADGYRIVIASASYAFYVSQVARLLGTDAVATQPTPVNHDVTPKIAGENCYGEAKLAMVKDWMKAQSIAREHTYIRFYSDHASDAPCLEWADEAFAANPHGTLRSLATKRGWTILDWD